MRASERERYDDFRPRTRTSSAALFCPTLLVMAVAKYRAILRSHLEKSYQQLCGGRKAAYVLALAYAATFVIAVVQHLVLDELGEVNGSTGSAPDTSCRCKGSLLTHHGNRSQPTRRYTYMYVVVSLILLYLKCF